MYRDDADAARAHLASMVRALAERRSNQLALGRYRHALSHEAGRLRRALRWVERSARRGLRRPPPHDLDPARFEAPLLPGTDRLVRALSALEPSELALRSDRLARELSEVDPRLTWLEEEVLRLRAECASLRGEVEGILAEKP